MTIKILMQQPVVMDWFDVLRSQNRSSHTLSAYHRDLSALSAFLVEQKVSWASFDKTMLHTYVNTRLERDALSVSSMQRELSSLRQFYQYVVESFPQHVNPFLGFSLKRAARPLPDMVDMDVLTQLLDQPAPEQPAQQRLWQRDKAMLELLYSSGLRVAELTGLQIADMDILQRRIRVTGKGNKTRLVPIGQKAVMALKDWLVVRNLWLADVTQADISAVFISQRNKRALTTRAVELRVTHHAKRAGIHQRIYPHLLRHCFASHLLSSSGDLRAVQELLGHADISTTQVYTHLDFDQLTRVYDGAHPRARRSKKS